LVEYNRYHFALYHFFNAHDSQVWFFDGLLSSWTFLSQLLSFLTKIYVFSLKSILSLHYWDSVFHLF
jgi:hypothetical protein